MAHTVARAARRARRRGRPRFILLLVAVAWIAGCSVEYETRQDVDADAPRAVTYAGDIPCADCPGQRITLTLFPDFTFRIRQTYAGRAGVGDESFYDLGRWARSQDGGARLALHGGTESVRRFRFVDADRLQMLDGEGREIPSTLNYELARSPDVDLVNGPMRLRGTYTQTADTAVFSECLTGKRFVVRAEGAHLELERAYREQRPQSRAPILMTVTGRFERSPGEGATPREHVLVERFDRAWPGETCNRQVMAGALLLGTYWRAVEIDGQPIIPAVEWREPHFMLSREGNRVVGSTGCNNLGGGFEQGADGFRFKGLLTTRMACSPPRDDLETLFLNALEATASQRIVGTTLELRDATGTLRMRLEATPAP